MRDNRIIKPIEWIDNGIRVIDQRKLPEDLEYVYIKDLEHAAECIKDMVIRGAPLIGIFAAYSLVFHLKGVDGEIEEEFYKAYDVLYHTRPTAYNLFFALDRMKRVFEDNKGKSKDELLSLLFNEAVSIHDEDLELSKKMGEFGANLLKGKKNILTHCNAGMLATGGGGTVMAVIKALHDRDRTVHIWVDETRPLLQGARLTAWELKALNIPYTVIADNMAGLLMSKGLVDAVIIGADRIARNYDVANKIGSYSLSVLAKYHNVPFYVVAPYSTFDPSIEKGDDIVIEERNRDEIRYCGNRLVAPEESNVYNPAFDVVPADNITAIITDKGIIDLK